MTIRLNYITNFFLALINKEKGVITKNAMKEIHFRHREGRFRWLFYVFMYPNNVLSYMIELRNKYIIGYFYNK